MFASRKAFVEFSSAFLFLRRVKDTPPTVFLIVCLAIAETSTEQLRLRTDSVASDRFGCTRQDEQYEQLQVTSQLSKQYNHFLTRMKIKKMMVITLIQMTTMMKMMTMVPI